MNIFCVIVTYNGMKWIDKCLSSILSSSIHITPIVVDNNSADNTTEYILSDYPNTILIKSHINLGFGQANNKGIQYALQNGATHVLLLNQDAWIAPDMIEKMLPYMDDYSLISPLHMTGKGDRMDTNFCKHAVMRSPELERLQNDWTVGQTNKYYTDEINAACWLLPRVVIEEIGGFNPLFFHYAEDNDYLQRIHYHQKGIYFIPSARVFHDRENIAVKCPSMQSIYQNLILRAVNINYCTLHCLFIRWRYVLAVIHTAIRERRIKDIQYLIQALMRYHTMHRAIHNNRKTLKTKGAHWIS